MALDRNVNAIELPTDNSIDRCNRQTGEQCHTGVLVLPSDSSNLIAWTIFLIHQHRSSVLQE